jgi:hypothetical protein
VIDIPRLEDRLDQTGSAIKHVGGARQHARDVQSFARLSFATVSAPSCSSVGKGMATAVEYSDGGFPMVFLSLGETWRLLAAKAGVTRRRVPPLRPP